MFSSFHLAVNFKLNRPFFWPSSIEKSEELSKKCTKYRSTSPCSSTKSLRSSLQKWVISFPRSYYTQRKWTFGDWHIWYHMIMWYTIGCFISGEMSMKQISSWNSPHVVAEIMIFLPGWDQLSLHGMKPKKDTEKKTDKSGVHNVVTRWYPSYKLASKAQL